MINTELESTEEEFKAFTLCVPNDYGCDEDYAAALNDCYDGDEEAAQDDDFVKMYDAVSDAATNAGLLFSGSIDCGAAWNGTEAQFDECVANLPSWAKNYKSKL